MHEPQEPVEAEAAKPDTLQVRHLGFAYSGGKDIIHNLSFDAKPGQIIGITGPVACGKSTLGKVFLCEMCIRDRPKPYDAADPSC